jgi:ubiquitin carboxyl-terminal hydrolase 5/13
MSCTHLDAAAKKFKRPNRSQLVHREECTLCFDGQDGPDGVVVCLQCFNGGCLDSDRKHAYLHSDKCSHPIGVVIKRTPKDPRRRVRHGHQTSKLTYKSTSPPPLKRLAINAPSDNELYDYTTSLRCFKCSRMGEAIASEHPNVTFTLAIVLTNTRLLPPLRASCPPSHPLSSQRSKRGRRRSSPASTP